MTIRKVATFLEKAKARVVLTKQQLLPDEAFYLENQPI